MSVWPDEFLRALSDLSEGKEDGELLSIVQQLGQIKASSVAARRLRPWLQLWSAHDSVLNAIESVARSFLEGFAAETPLVAQQAARQAQAALDSATETLTVFNELQERHKRVEAAESVEDAVVILVGQTFASTGADNIVGFDAAGSAIYERITGSGDCPAGMGIAIQLAAAQVMPLIDQDNFLRVVSDTWTFLDSRRLRFSEALSSPNWIGDFKHAVTRTHDVASFYGPILSHVDNPGHAARGMLDFIHALVEGAAGRHLSTLLSCVLRKQTYERLRGEDVGGMLNTASQQSLMHLLGGIDRTLRIAKAHEDWDIDGELVTMRSRDSTLTMDIEELTDKMLTALESVVALQLAITIAAGQEGVGLEELHPLGSNQIGWESTVALCLAFGGWTDVKAHEEEGAAYVRVSLAQLPKEPLQIVAMAVSHIPIKYEHARFELEVSSSQSWIIEGPLAPLRGWSEEEEGLQKDVLFWETAHLWTVDGSPRLSRGQVRKCVAQAASKSIESPFGEAIRRLRILREMALKIDDFELAEVLKSLMGSVRNAELDLPQAPDAQETFGRLMTWQSAPLPPV
jgi:hypothetical protein